MATEATTGPPLTCPGYDNQEHAPDCSGEHPLCPGGCGCRLGTDDADARECGCDGGCCGDE